VDVAQLASVAHINASNAAFYSLLVQAGYLSVVGITRGEATVCAPTQELRISGMEVIFASATRGGGGAVRDQFRMRAPQRFAVALVRVRTDALSDWDLSGDIEQVYHVFLLGGIVFSDPLFDKSKAKSNREAGDGRYDICMERNGRNYIFELKMCGSEEELDEKAELALRQIEQKRYGAELDKSKPIWKVGISCFGKQCNVKCEAEVGLGM
jgi:hypothetical protein